MVRRSPRMWWRGALAAVLLASAVVVLDAAPASAALPPARVGDYNGDGKTDMSLFRPSAGSWHLRVNGGGYSTPKSGWGFYGDEPAPGDYNGDGKADFAYYHPDNGNWYVTYTGGSTATLKTGWGFKGDIVVPGDYNGDGKADLTIWRPSTGTWYTSYTGSSTIFQRQWGTAGDIPVPGDYNGDGKSDMMVWRSSNYTWYVVYSGTTSGVVLRSGWGNLGDIPVPGDFNGDRKSDMMVFRPSNGTWYLAYTGGSTIHLANAFGGYDDIPTAGDYDGDGKSDAMFFRPSNGTWNVRFASGGGGAMLSGWGGAGDLPMPAPTRPGTPSRTDGPAKRVLFLHGFAPWNDGFANCNGDYWRDALNLFTANGYARSKLTTIGFYQYDEACDMYTSNRGTTSNDTPIEDIAKAYAWTIYNNWSRYGIGVDIVAHSMGGLITRVAITGSRYNWAGFPPYLFVEDVVTLSTPHGGHDNPCEGSDQCAQMWRASTFMTDYIEPYGNPQSAGIGTDWTAIGSMYDSAVHVAERPRRRGRLPVRPQGGVHVPELSLPQRYARGDHRHVHRLLLRLGIAVHAVGLADVLLLDGLPRAPSGGAPVRAVRVERLARPCRRTSRVTTRRSAAARGGAARPP